MTQGLLRDLCDLQWEIADRVIIVSILGVLALSTLQFWSLHEGILSQADIETLNTVYSIIGGFLVAYVFLPVFKVAIQHWEKPLGKGVAVMTTAVVVMSFLL